MGKLVLFEVVFFLLTTPMLTGQAVPIEPEDVEVNESEAERRFDALEGLSMLQRANAQFDLLRLPGMTHLRARAIVARFGTNLLSVDSIVAAATSMDSAYAPSRMVEPASYQESRTKVMVRSIASFDARRGNSGEAWDGKHLVRWLTAPRDGSNIEVDVSLPMGARRSSTPRFFAFATSASGNVSAAAGEFRSRERQVLLENADARVASISELLSLSSDQEAFSKTSVLEPSASVKGVGVSLGMPGPLTVSGIFGVSSNAETGGSVQELSVRSPVTPESHSGVTLLRLPSGDIGSTVYFASTNDRSIAKVSALVQSQAAPAYVVTGSHDLGKDFLFAYAFHTSGLAFGARWKQSRRLRIESFWSSDRRNESGQIWSASRHQSIQLIVGDPAEIMGRIRVRRDVERREGANPSGERTVLSASTTSTIAVSKKSSLSIHAQARLLRDDRLKSRSSLIVMSARHGFEGLTIVVWASSFLAAPGGTLWWQHPGYGSWPISTSFSGGGYRAGLHLVRGRVSEIEYSAFVVVGRTTRAESETRGGIMLVLRP